MDAERGLTSIDTFVAAASTEMWVRMGDGVRRGWGTSWQTDYPDADVMARLDRAVTHLGDALGAYRLDAAGLDEVRKRAADVANQAFMLADPLRLTGGK